MIDLGMPEHRQFLAKKEGFDVYLKLEDDILLLNLNSEDSMEAYTCEMNQQKIKSDKKFGFFFEKADQLFKFLVESFSEIKISKNGDIEFEVEMPFGKGTKKYEFKIETMKKEIETDKLINMKLIKMQKEIQEIKNENESLKLVAKGLKLESATKEEEIMDLKVQMIQIKRILQEKDQIINSIFEELRQVTRWKKQVDRSLEQMQRNKNKFLLDESNPHSNRFTQIGNRYKKNSGGSWEVITCKYEIEKNSIYKYYIKQIKAGSNGSFMYGIGTAAIKGLHRAQDSKEFIGYYQNTGCIYDRSQCKKAGPKIKDGETITLEIDTKMWKIIWYIEGVKSGETPITGQFKQKPIYLAVIVYNEDSEIEFL